MNCKLSTRKQLLGLIGELVTVPGDWAEFGVAEGVSARRLANSIPEGRMLYLFDSFDGLPEDWHRGPGKITEVGRWRCVIPKDLSEMYVKIVKGLFADTVSDWAVDREPLAFIHVDSDLYSSAVTVLEGVGHLIVAGTLILFDEYHGYEYADDQEARAWREFCEEFGVTWEVVGKGKQQLLVRVVEKR